MRRLLTLIACLSFWISLASAQSISWHIEGELVPEVEKLLPVEADSSSIDTILDQAMVILQTNGYLLAQVLDVDSSVINLAPGNQYRWAQLSAGNLTDAMISRTGFRPGRYATTPVDEGRLITLYNKILDESDRMGNPFASVRLDSILITDGEVSAAILYIPGPQVLYDTLRITGNPHVKASWLQVYLNVNPGDRYDQRSIDEIEAKLDQLPFIRQTAPGTVRFVNGKARIQLPLENVPTNHVDGIIGFLPNEDEGLRITGQAELSLTNLFRSGKSFDLFWQRIRPETQYLDIRYIHTNLLRTPIDINLGFNLLKEDTTFINREFDVAADYRAGMHSLYFISRFKSSRLLETAQYMDATDLPEVADFNLNNYGIGYGFKKLKPGWLGNNGWTFAVQGTMGNKTIRRNAGLPSEVYDDLDLKSLQGSIEADIQWGFRVGKRSLVYQHWNAGLVNGGNLFLNDLFRFGGFSTLRGFSENQFFAREYVRVNLEWQFFVGESSNFFMFVDQAWLSSLSESDNATGIGAGTTLQTGAGLLQIAYAVGRTSGTSLDFSKSKFHFGYIARF